MGSSAVRRSRRAFWMTWGFADAPAEMEAVAFHPLDLLSEEEEHAYFHAPRRAFSWPPACEQIARLPADEVSEANLKRSLPSSPPPPAQEEKRSKRRNVGLEDSVDEDWLRSARVGPAPRFFHV